MRAVLAWIAGIAASVISAVLIYHYTTPTPPPPSFTFEGMVIDHAHPVPIKQAMVVFEIEPATGGNGPYHDFTDENGSYKMNVSGLSPNSKVFLSAQANGFKESGRVLLAGIQADNRKDFELTPAPAPTPEHSGPTPSPTPIATLSPGLNRFIYVPRAVSKEIRLQAVRPYP